MLFRAKEANGQKVVHDGTIYQLFHKNEDNWLVINWTLVEHVMQRSILMTGAYYRVLSVDRKYTRVCWDSKTVEQ